MKQILSLVLKLSIAAGILTWMICSGKIDFNLLQDSLQYRFNWAMAFVLLMSCIGLTSIRWRSILLVNAQGKVPFLKTLGLTWVGVFFSTVLPGVISGDVVKMVLARKIDPGISKTYLAISVLVDRLIGLMALIWLVGGASALGYYKLSALSSQVRNMLHINFLLFLGSIFFFATLFLRPRWQQKILDVLKKLPLAGKAMESVLTQFWSIGRFPKVILSGMVLSLIAHTFSVLTFWSLAKPYLGSAIGPSEIFTFVPLGFMTFSIPITPAGAGLGHLVFDKLFEFFQITQGASLFNFYFVAYILTNLMGLIPYIFHRDELSRR